MGGAGPVACIAAPCTVYVLSRASLCVACVPFIAGAENVFEISYGETMSGDELYIKQSFVIPANVTQVQMRWVYCCVWSFGTLGHGLSVCVYVCMCH